MAPPSQNFELNQKQIPPTEGCKSSGNLLQMRHYLSEQFALGSGDPRISNCPSTAADINKGTGFYAKFVCRVTHTIGKSSKVNVTTVALAYMRHSRKEGIPCD